ncbi:hypothetical protein UB44_20300 [Burkholderiaceae bacterium 26]|uniref:hypothetical protein n=1 Tax=Ralstonia chuxiongensis TaxID=2957504 RepID=UPI0005EBE252|nr:hypothetical protein [Ralstonia chuxiongensis]KJJ95453.1 hypothetical protein UB44_20300 [Burkholderiaceae bacterium 26]CAJ0772257.1 hypothetical protein R8510_02441 [Ralstonia chuxiongensis]
MSASRTPYLPTIDIPLLRAGEFFPFAAHPILIGAYQLWFTCDAGVDADADPGSVTVCIDLGKPLEINIDEALHVILGLCLGLPASSRGVVAQQARTGTLVYRFPYTLHDDPTGALLVDAMSGLAASAISVSKWSVH